MTFNHSGKGLSLGLGIPRSCGQGKFEGNTTLLEKDSLINFVLSGPCQKLNYKFYGIAQILNRLKLLGWVEGWVKVSC